MIDSTKHNAKWVFSEDPSSYFLNEKYSNVWFGIIKGQIIFKLEFINFDDHDVLLYDSSRNLYVKILGLLLIFLIC